MNGIKFTIIRAEQQEAVNLDNISQQSGRIFPKLTAPCNGCERPISQVTRRITVCGGCSAGNTR